MHPATDSHAHVIDPARFPYAADTAYRPQGQEIGPLEQYLAVLDANAIGRGLLVQPTSGYGYDNRCLLDAVERSAGRLRAVVRIAPGRARDDIALLDRPQAAGVRFDLVGEGVDRMGAAESRWLLDALAERDALLQVQCERDQLAAVLPALRAFRGRIVVDHCGRPDPAAGLHQPGFQALLELGRAGHYVKLSGAFRFSRAGFPFPDCDAFVAALLETFTPRRCVWGSDWPYLRITGRIDFGPTLRILQRWLPDPRERDCVLRETPRRLFGFA